MAETPLNDDRPADRSSADEAAHVDLRPFDLVQRWMQAVITHPAGVSAGISSDDAQAEISVVPADVESVIGRSRVLGSLDRLAVYANAYYARLLECLRDVFPVVCRTMGEEIFDNFVTSYLQKYPSQSYTLNDLGARFAQFLDETRPPPPGESTGNKPDGAGADESSALAADWPRFVVDMARLEWTVGEVYDGPGVERTETLQAADIADLPPARWMLARLRMAPCVRLLAFAFPVNEFYTRSRELLREEDDEAMEADSEREELPIPPPEPSYLALSRRNYVVRRYPLTEVQFDLLGELAAGKTISEALAAATEDCQLSDDQLAAALHEWFAQWTADQFFLGVAFD